MQPVECPECGASVDVAADAMLGEILPCAECGTELEIVSLEPVAVELAPMEMEDWGE